MQEEVIEQVETVVEKTQEEILAEAIELRVEARLEARLKEERDKIAKGMLKEGRQRERNEFTKLFEKHGVELGTDPEATITSLFENMKQLQSQSEEKERAREEERAAEITTALTERDTAFQQRDTALASHNAYVIQSEIAHAFGAKAIDVAAAMKFFLIEHTIELNDGAIEIRNKSGEPLKNEAGDTATMEWVVTSFLQHHPYLAKATERKTDTSHDDITHGSMDFLRKPRGHWSESELQKTLQMVADGKIVNRDGRWVVR